MPTSGTAEDRGRAAEDGGRAAEGGGRPAKEYGGTADAVVRTIEDVKDGRCVVKIFFSSALE